MSRFDPWTSPRRSKTPDEYTRRARLGPAVLTGLPALALSGAAAFSPQDTLRLSGIVLGVITIVVCGLVRDRGRELQPTLWQRWGGSPTVRRLRWRDSTNPAATQRLHDRINAVVDHRLPDAAAEQANPNDAYARYEEAVASLRTLTREKDRFRLVFEENMECGFRRNALALRRIAISIASLVLLVSMALLVFGDGNLASRFVRWGTTGGISLIMLGYWWRIVSEEWCKLSGELYADRLLEAVDLLPARVVPAAD